MNGVGLVIRGIVFAALLGVLVWLGLELKKKWDREAQQAAAPPPPAVEAGP